MCSFEFKSGSNSSTSSTSEAVLKCKDPVLLTPLELKLSIESELVALPVFRTKDLKCFVILALFLVSEKTS